MRENEFRGQKCSDGKWVYGYYIESKTSWRGHKPHKSWIVSGAISNGGFFNILGRYAVKDDTVGQFTGLLDMNGKKIFEGDVIKCGMRLYVCEFIEGGFEFRDLSDGKLVLKAIVNNSCIIGNIHDNPELIKK
jgi:uncharacterized phage protein (TIGR01671 family)